MAESKRTWCRLHSSIRHNFKVMSMPPEMRWYYLAWLTLESDGTLDKDPPDEWIARELAVSVGRLREIRMHLQGAGCLTADGRVKNFAERQYKDMAGVRRQRRHRQKKKAAGGGG